MIEKLTTYAVYVYVNLPVPEGVDERQQSHVQ